MQKMKPEYAQKLLDGGYAFDNSFFSKNNDMLVVRYSESSWPYIESYYGTQLYDGQFMLDGEGYVIFSKVEPIVTQDTLWQFS